MKKTERGSGSARKKGRSKRRMTGAKRDSGVKSSWVHQSEGGPFGSCPDEVVLRICMYMMVRDICSLGATSKRHHRITSDRTLWHHKTVEEFQVSSALQEKKNWKAAYSARFLKRREEERHQLHLEQLRLEQEELERREKDADEQKIFIDYLPKFLFYHFSSLFNQFTLMVTQFILLPIVPAYSPFPPMIWIALTFFAFLVGYGFHREKPQLPEMASPSRRSVLNAILLFLLLVVSLAGANLGVFFSAFLAPLANPITKLHPFLFYLWENPFLGIIAVLFLLLWVPVCLQNCKFFVGWEVLAVAMVTPMHSFCSQGLSGVMPGLGVLLPTFSILFGVLIAVRLRSQTFEQFAFKKFAWVVRLGIYISVGLLGSYIGGGIPSGMSSTINSAVESSVWSKAIGLFLVALEMFFIAGGAGWALHQGWKNTITFNGLLDIDYKALVKGESMAFNISGAWWILQALNVLWLHIYLPCWVTMVMRCISVVALVPFLSTYTVLLSFYVGSVLSASPLVDDFFLRLSKKMKFMILLGTTIGVVVVLHHGVVQGGFWDAESAEVARQAANQFARTIGLTAASFVLFVVHECASYVY